ncbi:hypothetical protein Tco_1346918, partial [Tanacetum coccineum]
RVALRNFVDGHRTNTESEPFEDPNDTRTPESPLAIAPPIPLSESTLPVLVPIIRRTARMAVRVPHAMSSCLFAGMAELAAMSEFALCKRFQTSYESSPLWCPPLETFLREAIIVRTSCPTAKDEDPAVEDEDLTARVEGPGMDDEGYGLDYESHGRDDEIHGIDDGGHSIESDRLGLEEEEEAVPRGQQQTTCAVGKRTVDAVKEEIFLSEVPGFRSLKYKQESVAVTFGAIWRPLLAFKAWAGQTDAQRAALWHAINDMQGENRDLPVIA